MALIVNPHDPENLAAAIRRAIEMPLGERRARHRALWDRIAREDVTWWQERFLSALAKAAETSRPVVGPTYSFPFPEGIRETKRNATTR